MSVANAVSPILRPRVIEPGLRRWDPLLENYRVPGGGSLVVRLMAAFRLALLVQSLE